MKQIFLILAVLLAMSPQAFSQESKSTVKKAIPQSRSASTNKIEEELMKLEKDLAAARLRNDVAALDRYAADELIGTGSNGVTTVRDSKNINRTRTVNVTPAGETYESNELDELRVKVYGNHTAVANYRRTVKARTKEGKLRTIQLRETNTWVKQQGGWKKVAAQTTTISISDAQ